MNVVQMYGAQIIAVCSIFNRSKDVNFNLPYFYISKIEVNNYTAEECPLCKQNLPIVKPGSRKIL
ncbi:MAG: orotate phosphoribosyltransferase, partial [Candidatus Micrarchaeia archaeon]